jgi:hypothetical protein
MSILITCFGFGLILGISAQNEERMALEQQQSAEAAATEEQETPTENAATPIQ